MDRLVQTSEGADAAAPSRRRSFSLSNRTREWIAGYLFVAPDAVGLLIFVGGPMALSLSLGFFSVSGFGEYSFVGLDNYRRMAADPLFWLSLRVTVVYIVALVPALYVVGLGLALLVQSNTRFNGFVRSLLFMPQTVSLVVVGLIWQVLLVDKIGLFNQFGSVMNLPGVSWLGDPRFALYHRDRGQRLVLDGILHARFFSADFRTFRENITRRRGSTARDQSSRFSGSRCRCCSRRASSSSWCRRSPPCAVRRLSISSTS